MFKKIFKITTTFLLSLVLISCGNTTNALKNINIFKENKQVEFKQDSNLLVGKLDNGLTYYIFKNEKPKDNASLNLVVKVGSLMEDDSEQGIAHFMEHMAFNGTKKYAKNDMIKYLQSIGLSFGGDLNAYTTFDRTVFELQIPTKEKDLEDGIEVLREWASNVTLEPSEIEGEKNVVLEEWRLSQGLRNRLWEVQKKALFANSRYFDRFPIGLPEIIRGANYDLVSGFYNKWYQPHNMSVIAVGDFNPKDVEKLIKKYFNYNNANKNQPKMFELAPLDNKYVVFTDPELRHTNFSIVKLTNFEIVNSKKSLKDSIIEEILEGIINSRLNNLTIKKDSPLVYANMSADMITQNQEFIDFSVSIKEGKIDEGVKLLNNFIISSAKKGVSQIELDLEKENILKSLENIVNNKTGITNNQYIEEIVDLTMYDKTFVSLDDELALYKQIIPNIKIEDINKELDKFAKLESLYFLTGNSKIKYTDSKLENLVKTSLNNIKIQDFKVENVKLTTKKLTPGTIKSFDNNKYVLGNEIEVQTKSTTFDKDKIMIKLYKETGSSVDSFSGYVNSLFASGVIEESGPANLKPEDISTYMKGKNFSVSSYINDYEQGFSIVTNKEDLTNALDYMTGLIYSPKIDDNVFENTLTHAKEKIKMRRSSPRVVFSDELMKTYSGNNKRVMPINLNDLKLITRDNLMKEYKKKFSNFNGYRAIIVGSLDGIDINKIIKTYFASLPSNKNTSSAKSIGINVPKDIQNKIVKKGIDKKATTAIIFPYRSTYGFNQKTLYNGFAEVLDIALIENIREKIGGVYGISAYTDLSPNNFGDNKMIIYYSSDPTRTKEIKTAVIKTLKDLLYNNIDEAKINSVVKNYEVNYPIMQRKNSFWMRYIYNQQTIKDYKLATPSEYKNIMTKKNLQDYNKKAIDLNNYISVILKPEKYE